MGTRKYLFEIYRKSGHAPSKRFASPALGYNSVLLGNRLPTFRDH